MSDDEVKEIPEMGTERSSKSLNEVRDILIGAKSRDLEQRLTDLEQAFKKGLDQLAHRMEMELSNLEGETSGGGGHGVARKLEMRIEETEALLAQQNGAVRRKVTDVHDQVSDATERLARQIDMLTERLQQTEHHFRQVTDDLHEKLTRGLASLENRKSDNAAMAKMFEEWSKRLQPPD